MHALGRVTLADALRESSNVGIAKAALPLTPAQQYENLRDFGFGVPTGIVLPGEVAGTLRRPERWTARSPVALAIGYELSVTPIQMTMAYGALANGGDLMEPRLVRETRNRIGRTVERTGPRKVRSVLSPRTARAIGSVLVDVVEDGTGTRARMSTFQVAGKSGTSRMYVAGSGYEAGRYYASFAGFFPADDPQLVVFVKLNEPEGSYYGGATAAPVTRTTLEAVLAARQAPIDRGALLKSVRGVRPPVAEASLRFANRPDRERSAARSPARDALAHVARPVGLGLGGPGDARRGAGRANDPESLGGSTAAGPVPVPDVSGLPARVAVRRLHALGFRVRLDGPGAAAGTFPPSGTRLLPGDTVLVRGGAPPSAGRMAGGAPPGRRGEGLP